MAGCDPTGNGSALAGFGDQRNIELLVEGVFSLPQAIQIATFSLRSPPSTARSSSAWTIGSAPSQLESKRISLF
jgi:hypothetical protein